MGNLKAIAMATFGLDALFSAHEATALCHCQPELQNAAQIIENVVFLGPSSVRHASVQSNKTILRLTNNFVSAPGALPRRSRYSFENFSVVTFSHYSCWFKSKKTSRSLILQPALSRTETALILLMIIPLPLHAVSRVWPWPLAAPQHSVCSWVFSDSTQPPFAVNLKMLLTCTHINGQSAKQHEKVVSLLWCKINALFKGSWGVRPAGLGLIVGWRCSWFFINVGSELVKQGGKNS